MNFISSVSSCLSSCSSSATNWVNRNRACLKTAAKVTLSAGAFFGGAFLPNETLQGGVMGISGIALFQSILSHVGFPPRSWKQIGAGAFFSGFTAAKVYSQGEKGFVIYSLLGGIAVLYGDQLLDFCCGITDGDRQEAPYGQVQHDEPLHGNGVMHDVNDPY